MGVDLGARIGAVAQLGERLPCTQEVVGSNPIRSTTPTGDRRGIRDRWKETWKRLYDEGLPKPGPGRPQCPPGSRRQLGPLAVMSPAGAAAGRLLPTPGRFYRILPLRGTPTLHPSSA